MDWVSLNEFFYAMWLSMPELSVVEEFSPL